MQKHSKKNNKKRLRCKQKLISTLFYLAIIYANGKVSDEWSMFDVAFDNVSVVLQLGTSFTKLNGFVCEQGCVMLFVSLSTRTDTTT